MKYTFQEIRSSLPVKKNSNSSWWVKLWVRRASFFFTFLFINLGFSPNGVSILSIFVALLSCALFMMPYHWATILAVICINFWLILDCVDGNIARCRKIKTDFGEFVDDIGGYFTVAFIYLAIGVCVFNNGGLFVYNGNVGFIILGAISSICDILARLIHKDYEFFADKLDNERVRLEKSKIASYEIQDKHSLKYLQRRVGKELGISGTFMLFAILGVMFNAYDLMTLFYFAFNGFALVSTVFIYIWKADRHDRLR